MYDLVVVGAGPGGCFCAKTAAKLGLKTLIVEKKPEKEIGQKVCGDGILKNHFDCLNLAYPSDQELVWNVAGVKVYSPDEETISETAQEGFTIDRQLFGQRLLKEALQAGAELLAGTSALGLILKEGQVAGVIVQKEGSKFEIRSQLIVDASGARPVIRKSLAGWVSPKPEEIALFFREIRKTEKEIDDLHYQLYLNPVGVNGCAWIFPKGKNLVNVGLGFLMRPNSPNPKKKFYEFIAQKPLFQNSKIVHSGLGIVPVRRPLDSLVSLRGVLLVGDAGCQANPHSGEGIGPSMMAGRLAARAAALTLGYYHGDKRKGLWLYNKEYMRNYGSRQASADIFKIFFSAISNEDLNYLMNHKLISAKDMVNGEPLSIGEKAVRLFRGLSDFALLKKSIFADRTAKKIKTLYQNYPSGPEEFPEWQKEVNSRRENFEKTLQKI